MKIALDGCPEEEGDKPFEGDIDKTWVL